jgi:hypothetical protein
MPFHDVLCCLIAHHRLVFLSHAAWILQCCGGGLTGLHHGVLYRIRCDLHQLPEASLMEIHVHVVLIACHIGLWPTQANLHLNAMGQLYVK